MVLAMLDALKNEENRDLAWHQLPRIVDQYEPVGPLSASPGPGGRANDRRASVDLPDLGRSAGRPGRRRRGRCRTGRRSSWATRPWSIPPRTGCRPPITSTLMRLNWGPYLWMRCYNNGASFSTRSWATIPTGRSWKPRRGFPPGARAPWCCRSSIRNRRWG